ncbi:MAG: saccharopine dehydrogenase NADP-binding domain-containing protein [Microscillaceae bacterium]|nr:saccharopine dehydrogenase NADP-binding domain-containing protein [Microscillaceae bacterium]MDW8461648.1 saccharopine dehydrogenase C-terminal domain-containing protein [Cytophagales bacterium]
MKTTPTILLLGAGRSATYFIDYLAKVVQKNGWRFIIAENNASIVYQKAMQYPHLEVVQLNTSDTEQTFAWIKQTDVVVSLLPPSLHSSIAHMCLEAQRHLLTASYLPAEIQHLDSKVQEKGLLFLYEMGLDPGIDHLSAMQMIDKIKKQSGEILSFASFCGGLIAPEYIAGNPWGYKFTWNPQNVVLAGQGGIAQYKEQNKVRYVPYQQLFKRIQPIYFENLGEYEAYYNRNSLLYTKAYGLQNCSTIIRGTIRMKGFCEAWHALIQIGLTDHTLLIENVNQLTYRQFLESFFPPSTLPWQERLAKYLDLPLNHPTIQKILWLGLHEDEPIPLTQGTPAQILQTRLEQKWQLQPQDKDLILMQHQITYKQENKQHQVIAELMLKGENQVFTAMAKTVGLPLALAAELLLENKIQTRGVKIPCFAEIYENILPLLAKHGIEFQEKSLTKQRLSEID